MRVLIVDDHDLFARSLQRLLDDLDHIDVVGIATRVSGLAEQCAADRPDVALVDWNLPDGTGASAIGELRRADPEIRIVVLTGERDADVVVSALAAGCDGFVTKDRAPEELIASLESAHRGEVQLTAAAVRSGVEQDQRRTDDLGLSEREIEVVRLLADSLSNSAIAERLYLSPNTVRNHVQRISRKLGVNSRLEIVVTAARAGLVDLSR